MVSPLTSLSSKDVRGAKVSKMKVCNLAHSLSDVLTDCGTSGLIIYFFDIDTGERITC